MRGIIVPPQPPPAAGIVTSDFCIPLRGTGTVVILEYKADRDQHVRIDFTCLVPGMLKVFIDGRRVLEAKTYAGVAFMDGLFVRGGQKATVHFSNLWEGSVAGHIRIAPNRDDAADKAWSVLGVPKGSPLDVVTKAYRRKVAECHPDVHGGDGARLRELNHYYAELKNKLGG